LGPWWLPGWLDRLLPRISIEGGDYFAERDVAARMPASEAPAKA
jgi:putative drug exporter of the RND superfamily